MLELMTLSFVFPRTRLAIGYRVSYGISGTDISYRISEYQAQMTNISTRVGRE
jgi:hypothetical protein